MHRVRLPGHRRCSAPLLRAVALAVGVAAPAYGVPSTTPAAPAPSAKPAAPGPSDKPAPSTAADPDQRKADARRHFKAGAKAYAAGKYSDAIDQFLEANRLVPSPALSYNIARAYDKIGNAAQALSFYRDYLRRAPNASDKQSVDATIDKLEKALMQKGVQQVTVLSTPSRATVVMDGQPVGVTTWTGEIYPGRHRLTLRLEGYQDTEKVFNLPAHRAIDVKVELAAVQKKPSESAAPTPPSKPAPVVVAPPPRPQESHAQVAPWTWAALGVGVASLGGSLGFELARASAERQSRDASTQVEAASRYDTMKSRQTIARVLLGVGAAATVAGGVLLYLDLSHKGQDAGSQRVGFGCDGSRCGVVAGAVF